VKFTKKKINEDPRVRERGRMKDTKRLSEKSLMVQEGIFRRLKNRLNNKMAYDSRTN
jgi:hypothetical protein